MRNHKGQFVKDTGEGFKKGHKIWLGKNHSKEAKRKISIANSKPRVQKICSCGKQFEVWPSKRSRAKFCSRKCKNASEWKGDKISYSGLHNWVRRLLGKPRHCAYCGSENKSEQSYHWANLSRSYKRELSDWVRLCGKCHKAFDMGRISIKLL